MGFAVSGGTNVRRQQMLAFCGDMKHPVSETEESRKTLENASRFSEKTWVSEQDGAATKDRAQKAIKRAKDSRWHEFKDRYFNYNPLPTIGSIVSVGMGLFSFFPMMGSHWEIVEMQKQIDQNPQSQQPMDSWELSRMERDIQDLKETRAGAGVFFLLSGTLMSIIGGTLTVGYQRLSREVRQALAASKALEKELVQYGVPTDKADAMLLEKLEHLVQREAEGFSRQIAEFYNREPDVRPAFDQVFGSKAQLPTADTLKRLFLFYAYQQHHSEHPQKSGKTTVVSKLDMMKRVYVLMKTGREAGELFRFVEPSQRDFFGQQFSKTFALHSMEAKGQVENWMGHMKNLFQKEVEADSHIELAQKAMMTHGLSAHYSEGKHRQLKEIIQQLREQKQKIRETLKQDDPNVLTNQILLEDLNAEFTSIVTHLKQVLETNAFDLKVQEALASGQKSEVSLDKLQVPESRSRQTNQ